jgi:hypothetical protein
MKPSKQRDPDAERRAVRKGLGRAAAEMLATRTPEQAKSLPRRLAQQRTRAR